MEHDNKMITMGLFCFDFYRTSCGTALPSQGEDIETNIDTLNGSNKGLQSKEPHRVLCPIDIFLLAIIHHILDC